MFSVLFVPESACEGFSVKKAAVLIHQHGNTSAYLQIYAITHLQIYIITHLQIYIITHLQIYIITHLQIYIISHLQIYIISHLLIYIILHLLIYIITHLLIYIISHLQIYIISHLQIYISTCLQISSLSHCMSPSRSSFFLSKAGAGYPFQPFRTKWTSNVKNGGKNCDFEVSISTLSHEMDVERQKLRKKLRF